MSKQVIDGKTYWKDPLGRLMPEELIKEMDKERDELVCDFVERAEEIQNTLRTFKNQVFDDVSAFVQLSAEKYDVQIGGRKGNLTLFSYDGKYKLTVTVASHLRFDERIQAGKIVL